MSKDNELVEKLDTLIGMVRDVQVEQRRHAEAIAELRGEIQQIKDAVGFGWTPDIARLGGRIDQLAMDVALGRNWHSAE